MPFALASAAKRCCQLSKLAPVLPHFAASAAPDPNSMTASPAITLIHLLCLMKFSASCRHWSLTHFDRIETARSKWVGGSSDVQYGTLPSRQSRATLAGSVLVAGDRKSTRLNSSH